MGRIDLGLGGEQTLGKLLTGQDFNGDALPYIVIGNNKGTAYYVHRKRQVTQDEWEAWQPDMLSKSE